MRIFFRPFSLMIIKVLMIICIFYLLDENFNYDKYAEVNIKNLNISSNLVDLVNKLDSNFDNYISTKDLFYYNNALLIYSKIQIQILSYKNEIPFDLDLDFTRFLQFIKGFSDEEKKYIELFKSGNTTLDSFFLIKYSDQYMDKISVMHDYISHMILRNLNDLKSNSNYNFVFIILLVLAISSLVIIEFSFKNKYLSKKIDQINKLLFYKIMKTKSMQNVIEDSKKDLRKQKQIVETLLKESTHRIGNSLTILNTLIRNRLKYVYDNDAKDQIRGISSSIFAMASINRRLRFNEELTHTRLDELAKDIVNDINSTMGGDNKILINIEESPAVIVPYIDAISICTVLTEVINNSIKHAFSVRTSGLIKINISCEGGNTIKLEVEDDGDGLPERIEAKSNEHGIGFLTINSIAQIYNAEAIYKNVEGGHGSLFELEFKVKYEAL